MRAIQSRGVLGGKRCKLLAAIGRRFNVCSPINGADDSLPPGDPSPALPHLWHLCHLLSHSLSELLDRSRLSIEETPENLAAYELNRVAIRAWLAHLLRVTRTPAHASPSVATREDLFTIAGYIKQISAMDLPSARNRRDALATLHLLLQKGAEQ